MSKSSFEKTDVGLPRVRTTAVQDDYYEMEATVAEKWQGTDADRHDMATLGRVQELRRNFQFITMLGFNSTLLASWEVLLAYVLLLDFRILAPLSDDSNTSDRAMIIPLTDGGTAGLIWGYVAVTVGFLFVYASIAGMASMAPTAAGQYHWVSEFAHPSCQKYLSYITGWLCLISWQNSIVYLAFLAGTVIQGLLVLTLPNYIFERWHGTLLTIAIAAFSVLFNTFLAKKLPLVEGVTLILHLMGIFAVIIPLWVLAPRNNAVAVFTEFNNGGGWSSTRTSVMVGLLTSISALLGFDSAVHMSEEVKDAAETLPRSIMTAVALNAGLGFVMAVTICFVLGDVNSIVVSPTGYPFIQIFFNVTRSYAGTDIMVAIIIITLTASCIAIVATASRQLWSFARDNGVPFSSFLSRVTPGWNIPLNAVLVSIAYTVLLSMINIGSTIALNAICSLGAGAMLSSYMITIACVLRKRLRGEPLPERRWTLGRYGMAINIGALCFLVPFFVFSFFPLSTPVTPSSMNWGPVMYVGMIIFATVYYFVIGRSRYVPPVALVRRDI